MTALLRTAFGALHQPAPLLSRALMTLPDAPALWPEGEAPGVSCDCCPMNEKCPQGDPGL